MIKKMEIAMKVVICHESTIYLDENGNYYKLSMGNQYYERYKILGDELNACMRTEVFQKSDNCPRYHITLNGFRVISCPAINSLHSLIFYRKKAARIIEEEVKNSDYVVSCLPGWFGNLGCVYAKKYNKPLYVEIGGCAWDVYWNHGVKGKIMAPYFYFVTKKNVYHADYVLYVTKSFLQKRYPTKGEKISCANAYLEDISEDTLKERIQKIDGEKKSNKIIIGTIGSVDVKYKGQECIIRTLGKLKEKGFDNYEYQLVGGGNSKYLTKIALKYNVQSQVKFMGTKTHDDIFEWLKSIDIYAQPSKTEGLPRSLLEAMSCGVPSIGSTAGGIPELLSERVLFKTGCTSTRNIYYILMMLRNKRYLKEEAINNFEKSKYYDKNYLHKKRTEFLKNFKMLKEEMG